MSAETCQTSLFKEFLDLLHHREIDYVLVGDVRAYPDFIHSDVDIVIPRAVFEMLPDLIGTFSEQVGARVVQAIVNEATAYCFVIARKRGVKEDFFRPDLCSDYWQKGRVYLTAEELLANRQWDVRGFFVPAADKGFAYYLLKKIDKGDLDERKWSYLTQSYALDKAAAQRRISSFWPDEQAVRIIEPLETDDLALFRNRLPTFKRALRGFRGYTLRGLRLEAWRILRRIRQPTGLWISFLGPDGAGKTTLIENVRCGVQPVFGHTVTEHLRPHLGHGTRSFAPVTNPHQHPPRSPLASLLKLLYWWLDYTLGYGFKTLPRLLRSQLVIYDRYYHDILVDSKRYRYGGSLKPARWIGRFIPKPELWFILDAPPEVLQARKQEVPLEETTRQRQAYLQLSRELPNCHVIDVNRNVEEASSEIEWIILDYMERRIAKRFGWS